jgi:hypothetical protein
MTQQPPASGEAFRMYVVRSLEHLKTQMDMLVGNGQPGRITALEDRVGRHEKFVWVVTGGGVILGWLLHYILVNVMRLPLP